MRKFCFLVLCLVLTTGAYAQVATPTIYGKVNREVRMADNKSKFKYAPMSGIVDVQNSESRLGVKGAYTMDFLKSSYVLELGLHSTQSETDNGRIRIRRSFVTFDFENAGQIVMGKDHPALEVNNLIHDPLNNTGVGAVGADQAVMVKNITSAGVGGRTGLIYRGNQNILGYKTPSFYGLQLYTTVDREHADGVQDVSAVYPAHAPTHWQSKLTFDHKFDMGLALKLTAGLRKISGIAVNDDETMSYGMILSYMDFTFSGLYTDEKRTLVGGGTVTTPIDYYKTYGFFPKVNNKYMLLGLKYVLWQKNIFAVTYGNREANDGLTRTIVDKDEQTQIAFGYTRKLMDQVGVRFTYANLKKEYKDLTEERANGNKGQIYALGAEVTF